MIESAVERRVGMPLVPRVSGRVGIAEALPATRAGEYLMLRWVPESRIPVKHREYVQRHADRAAELLGLGHVTVRWFEPSHSGQGDFVLSANQAGELAAGVTSGDAVGPMAIGILAGMRGKVVAAVVSHEVRHIWQRIQREMLLDEAACENDAGAFSAHYLAIEAES